MNAIEGMDETFKLFRTWKRLSGNSSPYVVLYADMSGAVLLVNGESVFDFNGLDELADSLTVRIEKYAVTNHLNDLARRMAEDAVRLRRIFFVGEGFGVAFDSESREVQITVKVIKNV